MNSAVSEEPLNGGAKRKIRLGNEHMNLQPALPISGQKMRKNQAVCFQESDEVFSALTFISLPFKKPEEMREPQIAPEL